MKKKLLLVCSITFGMMSFQNAKATEMNYGLQAGGSLSRLSGIRDMQFNKGDKEENVSSGSRLFFTGGAFFNYAFTDNLGVGIAANYMGLGGVGEKKVKDSGKKVKDSGTGGSDADKNKKKDKYSVKTNNFAMPVTFQYYPMGHNLEDGIVTLYVGGQPNFAVGMNVEYKEEEDKKFKDEFKTGFSFDALAGISYQLSMGLLFDIRYTHGFTSVFKDDDETKKYMKDDKRNLVTKKKDGEKGESEPLSLKNRCFSLTVGYSLASLMS